MIRKLFIVAGAGLVLSVVSLGITAALFSRDMAADGWNWARFEDGDHSIVVRSTTKATETTTRALTWTGGDRLDINIPADVIYTQGPVASVKITGDKTMVDQVVLDGGRLTIKDGADNEKHINFNWNGGKFRPNSGHLTVEITAPSVTSFGISGIGDLEVINYDQPKLDLDISGAGQAEVAGRTQALNVDISGMGDAELENLQTVDANIDVSGAGDATIAATGKVNVSVSGTGNVDLKGKPASVSTDISGLGSVDQE
ncbi:DUF2807 domain-containing protein [Asticcacaulis sp. SL142]|uniref:GIN domain-containing protein n=1 Tax=Asticcacaulis sp. SL142 TaxID=2995155 RepID=UPI00226CF581|nr:DUF2807 domain-containing protein [Asticcacaulis sp. SL142]WAC49156.1 DUF2807 domain-containing protein [Asticcacaulis sp. SL142]